MIKDLLVTFFIVFLVVIFFSTAGGNTPEQQVFEVLSKVCLLFLLFVSGVTMGALLSSNRSHVTTIFIAFMCAFVGVCVWRSTGEQVINQIAIALWKAPIFPSYPPYPWGCSVQEIAEPASKFGTKRDEVIYPEIHITEAPRAYNYITDIEDSSSNRDADFPLGANN